MNGPQLRTPDARAVGLSTLSTFCGKPPLESRTRSAGRRKIGPEPGLWPRVEPRCPPRSVDSFVTFPGRPEVRMGSSGAERRDSARGRERRQPGWRAGQRQENQHRGRRPQEPRTADCNEARGRLGPPTSGQFSRWGPASRGSAKPAPMTLRPANVTAAPSPNSGWRECPPPPAPGPRFSQTGRDEPRRLHADLSTLPPNMRRIGPEFRRGE